MEQVLVVLLAVAVGIALVLLVLWFSARRRADSAETKNGSLAARVQVLQQYEGIHDATQAEAEIRQRAAEVARDAEARAEAAIEQGKAEAAQIKAAARAAAEEDRVRGQSLVGLAHEEAQAIRARAEAEAEQIAGAAWQAKKDAEKYSETATAMRNVIKGYGDEYLIPNRSLLDDLAEEFSHKDAGVQLKAARANTQAMVKHGTAAECDYKETRRRETAIHFVIDAFNGKVDSILSKARHDNFGKLQRQIDDAFRLVNLNGEAFRNARITPAYRASRIEELRWAVATNELKLQEREEQRRIKEEMREEERARREYENAVKQAQKEERMLEKAMAEARKKLEGAHAEQREEYERRLAELQLKWEEAEAKNQRALSMAQQTKRGHVYIISNIGSFGENVYKIGLTRRLEPMDRVRELGDASVPFSFDVHAMIFSEDAPALEKKLHRAFVDAQMNKVNARKEFFRVGLADIRKCVDSDGLDAHWTMAAEAAEYRESLAMERRQAAAAASQGVRDGEAVSSDAILGGARTA